MIHRRAGHHKSYSLSHQERFWAASSYAKRAARVEPFYAELAAETMKTAYNIALSDWFHPPVIERVERRGATLRVLASDNVRVARVWVAVLDGDKVIEEREAVPVGANWWELVLPGGRMVVQARDLAGNVTEREVEAR